MDFEKLKKSLEKRRFKVSCFERAEDALDYLDSEIDGVSVGAGGSMTLKNMGVYERLSSHNEFFWHWYETEEKPRDYMLRGAQFADIYLSSVNAMTEDGQIINIDGIGNRVGALAYGHKKIIFVVGRNKIAPDFDSAMRRARNVAAPLNSRRLGYDTPCARGELRCYDCNAKERICNNFQILERVPTLMEGEVLLINEDLGF